MQERVQGLELNFTTGRTMALAILENISDTEHIQPSTLDQWTSSEGSSQLLSLSYALCLFPVSPGGSRSVREGLLCLRTNKTCLSDILKQSLKSVFYRRRLPLLCVIKGLERMSTSRSIGKRATAISASSFAI